MLFKRAPDPTVGLAILADILPEPWTLVSHKGSRWIATQAGMDKRTAKEWVKAQVGKGRTVRAVLGHLKPSAALNKDPSLDDMATSRAIALAVPLNKRSAVEKLHPPSAWLDGPDHGIAVWRYIPEHMLVAPYKPGMADRMIKDLAKRYEAEHGKCKPLSVLLPIGDIGCGWTWVECVAKSRQIDNCSFEVKRPRQIETGDENDDEEFVRGDQAKIRKPPTLKQGWIPAEAFTLFVGRPKRGKSLAVAKMAAYITAGGVWFDGETVAAEARGSVIIIEEEDSREETLARCKAAGCDMSKVHVRVRVPDISNETQLRKVTDFAEKLGDCRMISFSPLQSAIPSADYNEAVVRAKFRPILRWARGKRIALIGVIHLDKEGKNVAGSDVIVRACRSGLAFDDHPDDKRADEFARRRVMRIMFSNVGKMGTMVPYDTAGATVTVAGEEIPTAKIVFSSAQTATVAGVVGNVSAPAPSRRDEILRDVYATLTPPMQNAVRFLMTFFQSRLPATSDRVLEAGQRWGVRDGGTLYRAYKLLGITTRTNGNTHALVIPPQEWPEGFERVPVAAGT